MKIYKELLSFYRVEWLTVIESINNSDNRYVKQLNKCRLNIACNIINNNLDNKIYRKCLYAIMTKQEMYIMLDAIG